MIKISITVTKKLETSYKFSTMEKIINNKFTFITKCLQNKHKNMKEFKIKY